MMQYVTREPVRFWSAVTGLVSAVVALLQLFGVIDWTADQVAGVMAVVAAAGSMFQFFFVREKVTPVE